jgi:hypothetical protein
MERMLLCNLLMGTTMSQSCLQLRPSKKLWHYLKLSPGRQWVISGILTPWPIWPVLPVG